MIDTSEGVRWFLDDPVTGESVMIYEKRPGEGVNDVALDAACAMLLMAGLSHRGETLAYLRERLGVTRRAREGKEGERAADVLNDIGVIDRALTIAEGRCRKGQRKPRHNAVDKSRTRVMGSYRF